MTRDAVRISERSKIMSLHDYWLMTPIQRDIVVDELNQIYEQRYGKGATAGGPPGKGGYHPTFAEPDDTPKS